MMSAPIATIGEVARVSRSGAPKTAVGQNVCGFCHGADGSPGVTFVKTSRGPAHLDCPKATDQDRLAIRNAWAQEKTRKAARNNRR